MSDRDLGQLLRESLAAHARQAPPAPDLAEPVIHRGRVVRRRRRVAGAAAGAVATVAVVGSVWGVFAPHGTEVMPAAPVTSVSRTAGPAVEVSPDGVAVRLGGRVVPLPAAERSVLSARQVGAVVVVLASTRPAGAADGGVGTLYVVEQRGARALATGAISTFAVTSDGARVAYVGAAAGQAPSVRVRAVADGQVLGSTSGAGVTSLEWSGSDLLLHRADGTTRWTPGAAEPDGRATHAFTAAPRPTVTVEVAAPTGTPSGATTRPPRADPAPTPSATGQAAGADPAPTSTADAGSVSDVPTATATATP